MIKLSSLSFLALLGGIFLTGIGTGIILKDHFTKSCCNQLTINNYTNITQIILPNQSVYTEQLEQPEELELEHISFERTISQLIISVSNLNPDIIYTVFIHPHRIPNVLIVNSWDDIFVFYYDDLTVNWYLVLLYTDNQLIEQLLINN